MQRLSKANEGGVPQVNLWPGPHVIVVMRPRLMLAVVPLVALAACSSSPPPAPPAARSGCEALKTWEEMLDGAVPTGAIARLIADAAKPSSSLLGSILQWEKDAAAGPSQAYELPMDVMMIDGTCDTVGVLNVVPGLTVNPQ
jgi:hypothetical protein